MKTQEVIDRYYKDNGECCAGCDHWRWYNSLIGDCTKSKLVSSDDRVSMLEIENISMDLGSGHVITSRDFVCASFVDSEKENPVGY